MRVIAGSLRGKQLVSPQKDLPVRPTSDLVRGALFDVLQQEIVGARFLDLFAGAGGIGIEALSRHARFVCFVESNRAVLKLTNKNISLCAWPAETWKLFRGDVPLFLTDSSCEVFDVIFADPPYTFADWQKLLPLILKRRTESGVAIVEHDYEVKLPLVPDTQKKYGRTVLSFFR